MKIVICWSHISGYMAACWRELAQAPGVDLFVLGFKSDPIAPFDPSILGDVRHFLMDDEQRMNPSFVSDMVLVEDPDVIVISGWGNPGLRPLASNPGLKDVYKIMTMDTPMRYDWKQSVGRRLLKRYLKNFDRVITAGERSFAYARYLGFPDDQIRKGTYGIDYDALSQCHAMRVAAGEWPRRFVFMGRYAPEKGLDTLLDGYAVYRTETKDPWDLVCYGRGPDADRLALVPGVTDGGFLAPPDQPAALAAAGAFVLASRFDPWPLVAVEAGASGLPLVCSTACGSPVEVLRDGYNGYTFATDEPIQFATRLSQIADRTDLAEWGRRSQTLTRPHAAEFWPGRVFDGLLPGS